MPFSHREKIIKPETEPKIEGKDFAELEAIKRDLFEKISKIGNPIFINRVFGHSVKDGFELAGVLGLSSKEILKTLYSESVSFKNIGFINDLTFKINSNVKFLDNSNSNLISNLVYYPSRGYELEDLDLSIEEKWQEISLEDSEIGELARDIDEYYSRFLSLRSFIQEDSLGKSRQVKIEKEKQTESEKVEEAERSGDRVLEWLKRSYEKNYETRLIKPIIWGQLISEGDFDAEILVRELERAGVSDEDITQLVYTPLIDLKSLKKITDKIGLDLESPDMAKKLEKFRWKPYQVAVRGEISHSKKTLLSSLIDEVEAQTGGQKTLVLGEDGQYKIVENTGDREKKEDENKEIDFKNFKEEKIGHYDTVYFIQEILGKLTFGVERKGQWFVIHGDKKLGPYDRIGSMEEILGKLTFVIVENGKDFIIHGDKKIGPYTYAVNPEEILGKLTFSVERNGQWFVSHGDKILGPYKEIGITEETLGKLTFNVERNSQRFIIHGDKEFGPYGEIYNRQEILGKLTFNIIEDGKCFIIHGDKKIGPYDRIRSTEEILGKLNFEFEENGKKFIQHGSEKFGPYDVIGNPQEISSKLTFWFKENNKRFIQHGSEIIRLPINEFVSIQEINNKLVYILKTETEGEKLLYYDKKLVFDFKGDIKLIKEKEDGLLIVTEDDGEVTSYTFDINKGDKKQEEDFKLERDEQKRIDLLNILESIGDKTDMDIIYDYFDEYYYYPPRKLFLKESLQRALSSSFMVKKAITEALKDSPKIFMSTMSAKADNTNDTYIEHLVFSLFPEIRENMRARERQNLSSGFGSGGLGRNERNSISPENNFWNLLSGDSNSSIEGGDPMDERQVEVLKLRESVEGMVATSIYGSYSDNRWDKVDFPVSEENSGVTKETTFEIPNTYGMKEIVLPKLINSKILMDRIKGIDASGKEISLSGEKNKLGEVRVKIPEGVDSILYSQTEDIVPKVPMDISEDEYNRYVRKIDKIYGEKLYESIATLPDEVRLFLVSIEDKSPKDKIIEVENFVRKYGYYDFKNREVQEEKRGKSISEVLSVMEFRMQEIKRSKPELREELQDKKYAGVCADFSLLVTAMLRELGIPSGVITGFRADRDSLSVNTTQAHAVSYAMWPSIDGKTDIIIIDGTPGGVTAEEEKILSRIRQHSLTQKEKEIKENSKQILEAAKAKLADFERILEENDIEKIKSLTNGELESVLNAGRYAGFDIKKLSDNSEIDNKVAFYNFIEAEIKRERNSNKEVEKYSHFSRGSELMDLVSDFADRYEKDGSSRKESLELLQKVIDIAEKSLDQIEKRVATAVVKYLEAVRMKGK